MGLLEQIDNERNELKEKVSKAMFDLASQESGLEWKRERINDIVKRFNSSALPNSLLIQDINNLDEMINGNHKPVPIQEENNNK